MYPLNVQWINGGLASLAGRDPARPCTMHPQCWSVLQDRAECRLSSFPLGQCSRLRGVEVGVRPSNQDLPWIFLCSEFSLNLPKPPRPLILALHASSAWLWLLWLLTVSRTVGGMPSQGKTEMLTAVRFLRWKMLSLKLRHCRVCGFQWNSLRAVSWRQKLVNSKWAKSFLIWTNKRI